MREKCKRLYEKEKGRLLPEKRERNKEKVWSDCCRTEVRKDGWQDHLATYKHKRYKEMEEGDVMRQEGKVWCETCRILPRFFYSFSRLRVSFHGVVGWKKDANLFMDDVLNSKKKNGRTCWTYFYAIIVPTGRVVQFGLRSIKVLLCIKSCQSCVCATSWNVAQLPWKSRAFGMWNLKPMWIRIFCTMAANMKKSNIIRVHCIKS